MELLSVPTDIQPSDAVAEERPSRLSDALSARSQQVLDLRNRQWPRRESPDFPAHSWAERPNSSAKRQSSSAPHMAKLACVTDLCPAESGGSHGRSSRRCVIGSPDFWAERSSVGSQLSRCRAPAHDSGLHNPRGLATYLVYRRTTLIIQRVAGDD